MPALPADAADSGDGVGEIDALEGVAGAGGTAAGAGAGAGADAGSGAYARVLKVRTRCRLWRRRFGVNMLLCRRRARFFLPFCEGRGATLLGVDFSFSFAPRQKDLSGLLY